MNFFTGLITGVLIFGVTASGSATTIDFEEFQTGDVVSGAGVFTDLVFSRDGSNIVISSNIDSYTGLENFGGDFGGSFSAKGSFFWDPDPFTADFNISGVTSVSVAVADNGQDYDDVWLNAYNSAGFLINTDLDHIPAGSTDSRLLSVTGPGISYVTFGSTSYSGTTSYPNSLYFDNFTYLTEATPTPEPATMLLFGTGLVGLVGSRLRKKKK